MADVYLDIEYREGVISIPFIDLQKADQFTRGFNSYPELYEALNKLLHINIKWDKVFDINIRYEYINRHNQKVVSRLPIRLSSDDYDIEDLKEVYAKYYKDDHSRILFTTGGIKHVAHDTIKDFLTNVKDITDRDIDLAVNSYFMHGSYKKYRDAYFAVNFAGYDVKESEKEKEDKKNINLGEYSSRDEFLDYLIRYSLIGEDERDKAIEILSLYDLDDLSSEFANLFDGLKNKDEKKKINLGEEEVFLCATTGYNIEELRSMVGRARNNYHIGRGRR